MAYSPYPFANGEEENPCIAVTNDMLYWTTPKGLANPVADNEETGCDELKDPHLLYRGDLDRLEMWYLGRLSENLGGDGTSLMLFRKYSEDGIHWSEYEVMTAVNYLSPTVIWDGTKYLMWSIGYDLWNTEGTVVYQESGDGYIWSAPVKCEIGGKTENIDIWHGAVTLQDGTYHLVFVDETDKQEVWYCSSTDRVHYSEPTIIVNNNDYWNYLYRPTLIWGEDQAFCIYGVVTEANQWYLSMSAGPDVGSLCGIDAGMIQKMYPLKNDVIDTKGIVFVAKELHSAVKNYIRLELAVLLFVEMAAIFLWGRRKKRNMDVAVCSGLNLLISGVYIALVLPPYGTIAQFGAILALIITNVCMSAVLLCVKKLIAKD